MKQDYKYNGKEMQDELNLGWLDYGARMYMPEIGRWGAVDEMSEKFYEWSVYKYALDNPTNVIDPDGRCEKCLEFLKGMKQGALDLIPSAVESIANKPAQLLGAYDAASQGDLGPALQMAFEGSGPGIVFGQMQQQVNNVEAISTGDAYTAGQAYGGHLASGAIALATEGATGALKTAATNKVNVYRGVNENHAGFKNAKAGKAAPKGGKATAKQHNDGNTNSEFTSWSLDFEVAENFASRPSGSGVLLQKTVSTSKITPSPSTKSVQLKKSGKVVNESEVLLKKVTNAKVTTVN